MRTCQHAIPALLTDTLRDFSFLWERACSRWHHCSLPEALRRNVTIDEVGNAGAFLCSDLASGISGEIMYVDGGFNTTAMGSLEE